MTKPQTRFKTAKIRSYVHWPLKAWSDIEEHAAALDIPNHWVVMAFQAYVSKEPSRRAEFRHFLANFAEDQKSGKGSVVELLCGYCGFRAQNVKGADIHRDNCEIRKKQLLKKALAPVPLQMERSK